MLSEIAAEALHFLSRRDLDRACAVSKWLDALIAQNCNVYALRPVFSVAVPCENFTLTVVIKEDRKSWLSHSFGSVDEAMQFAASVLRHSYVEDLQFGAYYGGHCTTFLPDHWTTLVDAVRTGAVQRLSFNSVDFSELDDDTFHVAVECSGVRSLAVESSVVPSGFVTDELIRSIVAQGVHELRFSENKSDTPHRLSEDALLDFYLPPDATPGTQTQTLALEGSGVTDKFVAKFFERVLSSPVRHSGSMKIYGAAKQRGLSAYAHYMSPRGMHGMNATYRFPSIVDNRTSYEVKLGEYSSYMYLQFCIFFSGSLL